MKRSRLRFSALLVAGGLAAGCGSRGGGGSGFTESPSVTTMSGPSGGAGGGGVQEGSAIAQTIMLPSGYEQPRGIALSEGILYVSARESATQRAVILEVNGASSQVIATGDVLGTPSVMTD